MNLLNKEGQKTIMLWDFSKGIKTHAAVCAHSSAVCVESSRVLLCCVCPSAKCNSVQVLRKVVTSVVWRRVRVLLPSRQQGDSGGVGTGLAVSVMCSDTQMAADTTQIDSHSVLSHPLSLLRNGCSLSRSPSCPSIYRLT